MEISQIITASEAIDLIPTLLAAASKDPIAFAKLSAKLIDKTYSSIQRLPYRKVQYYFSRLCDSKKDTADMVKLNNILFGNEQEKDDNALKLLSCVIDSDTKSKLDWIANLSKACSYELISADDMFRLMEATNGTLQSDLKLLSSLIENEGPFSGDMQILSLARQGLMISCGIDGNRDIEKQDYEISSLGYLLDEFGLSYDNEKRKQWHERHKKEKKEKELYISGQLNAEVDGETLILKRESKG